MMIKLKSINIIDSGITVSEIVVVIVKTRSSVIFSVDIMVKVVDTVKVVIDVFQIVTMEASATYDIPIVE